MKTTDQTEESNLEELLTIVSWKDEMPDDAKKAFREFCQHFDDDLLRKCEIICDKWNYSPTVALEIRDCTFSRVWKYANSFDLKKIRAATVEEGIKFWLYRIASSQLANYHQKSTCHEPEKQELDVITSIPEMVDFAAGENMETRRSLRKRLEVLEPVLNGLNEKKRIIYLTYKTYEHLGGKYPPRSATKKLREHLNLAQASIRKYYGEACEYVEQYLNNIHGKK